MAAYSGHPSANKVFEPLEIPELLRGWLLHLHKGRDRHDLAARRYDRIKTWMGALATGFSAIVGTTVFATLDKGIESPPFGIKVAVALVSILAAILTGVNSFLNLSERTEKHRAAGVQYKALIWEVELIRAQPLAGLAGADSPLVRISKQLQELEQSAPVVPERIYDRVEHNWKEKGVEFVPHADDLTV
ncbi:MAG: SLATT domain-containing protein [Candidatus Sulfotelmatobacter sp.]|jgi:hypothetical protein